MPNWLELATKRSLPLTKTTLIHTQGLIIRPNASDLLPPYLDRQRNDVGILPHRLLRLPGIGLLKRIAVRDASFNREPQACAAADRPQASADRLESPKTRTPAARG